MLHPRIDSILRILKYAFFRALSLMFAIVVSVWLTITVAANSGVLESEISGGKIGGWFSGVLQMGVQRGGGDYAPYQGTFTETVDLIIRGLTLNLGPTNVLYLYSSEGMQNDIRSLIMDFLSRTLVLFGTANLLIFFLSISLALLLYRNYGGFFDRLAVTLSPLSSVPAWLYGLVMVIIAAKVFHFFPAGILDEWPDKLTWDAVFNVLRRLALPVLAIFISKIFQSIYAWRTFFLVHASEDYVEMGKAKGLSNRLIDRQYVIRPALPSLLTSFAILVTSIWQEAIIIELFFGVAGIGHLFYNALRRASTEMPLLIGLTVTFAYLLAISVFLLDIIYALVDPRVRIEGQSQSARPSRKVSWREWLGQLAWWKKTQRFEPPHLPEFRRQGQGLGVPSKRKVSFRDKMQHFVADIRPVIKDFGHYPSAMFGLAVILVMVGVSIYAVTAYPYEKTVGLWRSEGNVWRDNPKSAAPAWTNFFRFEKLAETRILSTKDGTASKEVGQTTDGMTPIRMEFAFDYNYDVFPTELIMRVETRTGPEQKNLFISPTWIMPDGREVNAGNFSTNQASLEHHLLLEDAVKRKTLAESRKVAWFSMEGSDPPVPLKGRYVLRLDVFTFEPQADIDAQVMLHGQLYGLAGTDEMRRNLLLPLLWGTPIALTFGLVGALLASLTTMILAAVGTWFGGWVDALIQRLTEINMVLPAFPLLVLVYISISKNIWFILGLAVLLSMMNNAIKNYRAAFIQIKESAYIEAARAYGASDWRIIFQYLIPRILPVLVPQLVSLAPGLVFLEATLAYLNISDPTLPTWGKLIQESIAGGALNGAYYQVAEPVGLLLITGLALSMIGFALDRILNPRLRDA
jgi:peptide/nickel transport system permease protein